MGNIVAPVVSLFVGGALAAATGFGLISAQTGAPDQSPGNAESPSIEYGTITE